MAFIVCLEPFFFSFSKWTDDPFLQGGRFANPYRILDRTTTFLIRDVIERGSDNPEDQLFRVLLFSTFMKIETYETLEKNLESLTWKTYSRSKYMSFLNNTPKEGSWFTGSYQKPAPPFGHKSHLENHLALLEALMTGPLLQKMQKAKYLQNVFEYLRAQPGLGNFTAFQFLLNLTYTPIMNFSGMDFVVAGLGAESGIAKMFSKKSLKAARENVPDIPVQIMRHLCETQDEQFKRLALSFSGLGPDHLKLDLADIEHSICEVDKYARIRHPELTGLHGRKEMKKRYDPSSRPFPEMAIPKAWSHPDRQTVRICPDPLCIERQWVILKISAHRKVSRAKTEYLVHWEGYSDAEATWEPRHMLQEDAPLALERYLASVR